MVARAPAGAPVTFTLPFGDGTYRFVAQSVDAAGNVSFFTAPRMVTVDRTLKSPTISLDTASASFLFGPGQHTTLEVVTLVGTAEPGALVRLDGGTAQAIHSSGTSTFPVCGARSPSLPGGGEKVATGRRIGACRAASLPCRRAGMPAHNVFSQPAAMGPEITTVIRSGR